MHGGGGSLVVPLRTDLFFHNLRHRSQSRSRNVGWFGIVPTLGEECIVGRRGVESGRLKMGVASSKKNIRVAPEEVVTTLANEGMGNNPLDIVLQLFVGTWNLHAKVA